VGARWSAWQRDQGAQQHPLNPALPHSGHAMSASAAAHAGGIECWAWRDSIQCGLKPRMYCTALYSTVDPTPHLGCLPEGHSSTQWSVMLLLGSFRKGCVSWAGPRGGWDIGGCFSVRASQGGLRAGCHAHVMSPRGVVCLVMVRLNLIQLCFNYRASDLELLKSGGHLVLCGTSVWRIPFIFSVQSPDAACSLEASLTGRESQAACL